MSRSLWRCRNRECPVPHGAVLGRVTADGGLVLDPGVMTFRAYLDNRRVAIVCPRCGQQRQYRGDALYSAARQVLVPNQSP
jgi:hypothetical protein